ncbi:glycosyltransferase family 4 protein [Zobellella denitrificans]|uniref:glycosyltransferase family 4 protein n=1 Tax=Zobellella denitrificans TaxID=347534 RepID=UPI001595D155|nr:glycosyltransferase family 4 protein [Zobellella denitrificans]
MSKLKLRLADMKSYLDNYHFTDIESREGKGICKPYNGNVVCVFHSCGAYDPSGYASRSSALIEALKHQGVNVHAVVRPGYPWDLPKHNFKLKCESKEYHGISFTFFPRSPVTLYSPESDYIDSYAEQLCNYAEAKDVSVFHAASNYLNGIAVAKAGRKLGVKSIYELRGLWHITKAFSVQGYESSEHYQYVEKRELEACIAVDHVVTLSEAMAEWLAEKGVCRNKISVVGNATFLPKQIDEDQVREKVRERYGIPFDAKVIGYLGSLVEYEGLDLLIQLHARTIEKKRPYLLIVGGGKQDISLKKLAKSLGAENRVIFTGRVDSKDVSAYYLAMDAVALPRKDHLLTRLVPAIKPFEVMAHNRPLLISRPLAQALGDTVPKSGYRVVDFEQAPCLFDVLSSVVYESNNNRVPTWQSRALELLNVYKKTTSMQEEPSWGEH